MQYGNNGYTRFQNDIVNDMADINDTANFAAEI